VDGLCDNGGEDVDGMKDDLRYVIGGLNNLTMYRQTLCHFIPSGTTVIETPAS
jgi:hypothetical protein